MSIELTDLSGGAQPTHRLAKGTGEAALHMNFTIALYMELFRIAKDARFVRNTHSWVCVTTGQVSDSLTPFGYIGSRRRERSKQRWFEFMVVCENLLRLVDAQ